MSSTGYKHQNDHTNEPSSSRRIQTPQLMVMNISSSDLFRECKDRMLKADALSYDLSVLSTSKDDNSKFAAVLIHHFPRIGGEASYGDLVLEHIPQPLPPYVTRMRLYLGIPRDKEIWNNSGNLKRVGMIGLLLQTFIAAELSNFHKEGTNDLCKYLPFLDVDWLKQQAEIPIEERTMGSMQYVSMSDPQTNDMTPSVAVLKLDRLDIELNHEFHIAKYIRSRLRLLGQLDPNRILHLVLIPTQYDPSISDSARKDKVETVLDVSVIRSANFDFLPTRVSQFHDTLSNTDPPPFIQSGCCWRIFKSLGEMYALRRTVGGSLASFFGAVVHEVGHLFKIPHTNSGIMNDGGENIQTFFLPNKVMNLGFTIKDFPNLRNLNDCTYVLEAKLNSEYITRKIVESLFDPIAKALMTEHPLITHKSRAEMCPIHYNEHTGVVVVKSGVRYVVYYMDDSTSRIISFRTENLRKRVVLEMEGYHSIRALIVSGEGNFLLVVVPNKGLP